MSNLFYKLTTAFLFSVLFLLTFQLTSAQAAYDNIANKSGDIIVTNDTFLHGITGHVGIYITPTLILHTSGRSDEPYPTTITESEWHNRYKQSKVVRPNDSTLGMNAANRAIITFKDKKIPYAITPVVTNISSIYCSELVWYSYYEAGKYFQTMVSGSFPIRWSIPTIILPYDFINAAAVEYNDFTIIDNSW